MKDRVRVASAFSGGSATTVVLPQANGIFPARRLASGSPDASRRASSGDSTAALSVASFARASCSGGRGPPSASCGTDNGEFQNASKLCARPLTAGPTTATSKSPKRTGGVPISKYSSATLRPPTSASAPSTTNSLLCIRWLTRGALISRSSWCRIGRSPR